MKDTIFNKEMLEEYNKTIEESLLYKQCDKCYCTDNNIVKCKCQCTKKYICNECLEFYKNRNIDNKHVIRKKESLKQLFCLCVLNN